MAFWRKLSVFNKLYLIVAIFIVLISFELFICFFAMNCLHGVRAFVGGEGIWSKAQKNAILNLHLYVNSSEKRYYLKFQEDLEVIRGDSLAREEFEKDSGDFNVETITEGFLIGKISPADIPVMIKLVKVFKNNIYFSKALGIWKDADSLISELREFANAIRQKIENGSVLTSIERNDVNHNIENFNEKLSIYENEFSSRLFEAARYAESVISKVLVISLLIFGSLILLLTIKFNKRLSEAIAKFSDIAKKIGNGDFDIHFDEKFKCDFQELTSSFKRMIFNLEKHIEARELAEHSNLVKNLFMANMSHEIRNPLNSILGFSELLRAPNLSETDKNVYLDIVKKAGSVLSTIINDVLDISKIENNKLVIEMRVFSLFELLEELKIILDYRCQEKGIDLKIKKEGDVSEFIFSDPIRLRQILMNVVGNAIKFTEKGFVMVTFQVSNNNLLFKVADSGIGVSESEKVKLFFPFSQGDVSNRKKYGGSGLGLFLSNKLCQMLGGEINLKSSAINYGSIFEFYITYTPKEKVEFESKSLPFSTNRCYREDTLSHLKALIVEDSLENQLLLQTYLKRKNVNSFMAANGSEALRMYLKIKPDFILMDMQMPILDGYSATEELRKLGCKIPIIAITGYAMKEDSERCLNSGCDAYLSKPVNSEKLLYTVLQALEKKSLEYI
ncbi:MAG: response regulator [Deltaproteobacteria bacterium]|nr:response regulator [Deltaproteobacteria bacterium]